MAGADGIDVESLHDFYVLNHPFHADHVATIRVHLMSVSAFDEDRLAVDEHLGILYLHFSEAYLHRSDRDSSRFAPGSHHFCHESVEIRRLCGPFLRLFYHHVSHGITALYVGYYLLSDHLSLGIIEGKAHRSLAFHLGINMQRAVSIAVSEVWSHAYVLQAAVSIAGIEVTLARNTRETPEVLVLTP